MNRSGGKRSRFVKVFGPPLVLAMLSAFGFVAAFGFGAGGQALSWLGVGAPILVVIWFGWRHRRV